MQLAEISQETAKVVHLVNSFADHQHDGVALLFHQSGSGAQINPVGEVGLGLWVDHEHSMGDIRRVNIKHVLSLVTLTISHNNKTKKQTNIIFTWREHRVQSH